MVRALALSSRRRWPHGPGQGPRRQSTRSAGSKARRSVGDLHRLLLSGWSEIPTLPRPCRPRLARPASDTREQFQHMLPGPMHWLRMLWAVWPRAARDRNQPVAPDPPPMALPALTKRCTARRRAGSAGIGGSHQFSAALAAGVGIMAHIGSFSDGPRPLAILIAFVTVYNRHRRDAANLPRRLRTWTVPITLVAKVATGSA